MVAGVMGRPTIFSETVADMICERIATGESLRSICRDEGTPSLATVIRWLTEKPDFQAQYTQAREVQADTIFDEVIDIADDASNDWMERRNQDGENIGWQINGDHVQRSRLRIETRKWMAGKMRPKVYGDKVQVSGDPENPVKHEHEHRIDADAFTRRIAGLVARGGADKPSGDAG